MFRIRSAAVADNLHLQVVAGIQLAEPVAEAFAALAVAAEKPFAVAEHPDGQPSMR